MDHYKEFSKLMEKASYRHGRRQVFSDFVSMAVCALHPINIASRALLKDEANEAEYMAIIGRYEKDTVREISQGLSHLFLYAKEHPYGDLLGTYFEENISLGEKGQFFTPEHLCQLMARMTMEPGVEGKTVADPACGSGRNLLAAAQLAPHNTFFAQDVDVLCAKMTVLNYYLNGLSGEVAWMNTLSLEHYQSWWVNVGEPGILPVPREKALLAVNPIPAAAPAPVMQLPVPARPPSQLPLPQGQLSLF